MLSFFSKHLLNPFVIAFIAFIDFMVLFFIIKLIKKKVNPLNKIYFWVIGILTVPVLYGLFVVLVISEYSHIPSRNFTTQEWIAKEDKRVEIIDDLVKRKLIDGKSKAEVLTILGEPLKDCEYFRSSKYDMIYCLGPERGLISIDNEWLLIWFEHGTVKKYDVWRD